ncbi:M14 family metallopeptidase [Agromyces sp. NPDC055520]
MATSKRTRLLGRSAVIAALAGLALTTLTPFSPAAGTEVLPDLTHDADEAVAVVEVIVADHTELDRLVDTGIDLDHGVRQNEDGTLTAQAIISDGEADGLRARGFTVGETLYDENDSAAVMDDRTATIAAAEQANTTFAAEAAADASDVRIIRADYYTSFGVGYLSVEAKFADGQTSTAPLTVVRDSGSGTERGSGGTQNITRFVDAGVYLYHRGAAQVAVRPDTIQITSPTGDVATAKVTDWLPLDGEESSDPSYQRDFITSYLTPQELTARIQSLAAEFPDLAEIVEMPNQTAGYQRHAQAVLGNANQNRVGIDSKAWGHEGGNDVTVALTSTGAANAPLSVSVAGSAITVGLSTDAGGAVTSTAAQVVSAINASPEASALVFAYTYRGNAGTGAVAPATATLDDGLNAPESVARGPQSVYALQIGKVRDGSKPGVLFYAQEHAREWVPPLVTIETAERLLRNYASDAETKKLVNNLEIWIVPTTNPDGGTYSFYDFASQRKNMVNYCPITGNADFNGRNSWGVDVNRNYDEYSLFDGFSGGGTSCTGGTYSGPSELSESESRNIDWIAANNPNITFSMNLHSSGNYFMWSPGAYRSSDRLTAPRPTLEEESFFWGASSRILTAIKEYRGMSVTPARTGPVADVLYSAAGNSGDMLWYKYGINAWDFEVGTSFQPPFENEDPTGGSAHAESQEFSNGLIALLQVAVDHEKDHQRPVSTVTAVPSAEAGMVDVTFETSEPASVFYTLDGSKPTFESTMYGSAGVREGAETLTVPAGTKINWFSVDSSGNVEKNYRPDGNSGSNFNKATVK